MTAYNQNNTGGYKIVKIIRFCKNEEISHGLLQDKKVKKVQGNIFSDYVVEEEEINLKDIKLLSPVEPPNIIAVGLNYKKHADENKIKKYPERPVLFLKATTSVVGPEDNIVLPEIAPEEVDYEAELVVVIGKKAKNISIDEVDEYIFGYTCANDVSARDCQLRLDKQWARAKSFDTFCPLGPWIETDIDPDNCNIKSRLNGKIMQDSNTANLIFDVKYLVSYCSKNMTLLPGTIIMTGTPEGVGFARKPPVYLCSGDKIEIEIEGIGKLENHVCAEK